LRVVHADRAAKSVFGFFCRFGQKKRKELTQAIPRSKQRQKINHRFYLLTQLLIGMDYIPGIF
jgi:hypothetical protein